MSGTMSYDESVGASAHTDVQSVISGLESSLSDLSGFVSAVKSSWDGDEMDEYAAVQAQWDKAAGTVREILTSVHQVLGGTNTSVGQMRSQVRGALSKSS